MEKSRSVFLLSLLGLAKSSPNNDRKKLLLDFSLHRSNIFPDISNNYKISKWLSERAILAPKNVAVDKVNEKILQKVPGAVMLYKSVDSVIDLEEAVQYPTEFLNS